MTNERSLSPTFNQELLSWLGDEPQSVREQDARRVHDIAADVG